MKRTLATLGAVGLAALAVAAPATADNDNKAFCHAAGSGYQSISIAQPGFNGHEKHKDDIIPPSTELPDGLNWDTGKATFENKCVVPAKPPVVVDPPVSPPAVVDPPAGEKPVVTPPVETPVVVDAPAGEKPVVTPDTAVVQPPAVVAPAAASAQAAPVQAAPAQQAAAAPKAAPAAVPAAPASVGTNQGYNAQTAVGGTEGLPGWLAGVGALAAAGAVVAVRRRPRPLHNAG
ncbi:hypothetical protein [Pseudarthrobacter sp. C4D7]|uniref:hypothetical protein n=1 Tax=Pseudarthrobacter sp. C4D7 TaxID=2735268 RepID=UPI00158492B8|nr:hypothetical protein [Pseudarthrobacter sp. C4D7]NUT70553.1 hypothetical protein [Pseudarthrobacter sp. C4D7]